MMGEFQKYMDEERKRVKGSLRTVMRDCAWLTQGEVIEVLDINVTQIKVKSLNTGNSGWLNHNDIVFLTELLEGGL